MSIEFDIRPMVENRSAIPMERLRVLRSFDGLHLPEMQRGIVFVFAAWSVPAVMGFQRLTKMIKTLDTGSLDLVVLDIDCLTAESAELLFGAPGFTTGGWGETLWVRDGQIVARALGHSAPDALIEEYTRGLLDA